jgi:hypothetical protein
LSKYNPLVVKIKDDTMKISIVSNKYTQEYAIPNTEVDEKIKIDLTAPINLADNT